MIVSIQVLRQVCNLQHSEHFKERDVFIDALVLLDTEWHQNARGSQNNSHRLHVPDAADRNPSVKRIPPESSAPHPEGRDLGHKRLRTSNCIHPHVATANALNTLKFTYMVRLSTLSYQS